jgi:cytochrome c553
MAARLPQAKCRAMPLNLQSRAARRIGMAGLATLALLVAALAFAWSGLYNISATRGHWPPVKWFLHFGMQNSVKTHAIGIEAPRAYSEDQVILGAGHYHHACASCHGAPGFSRGEAAQQMLPPPPDLAAEIPAWRDRELFWIVKNGIKYTGMPGWVSPQRDDEVWAVVAFLKRYPALDAEGYRRLARGPLPVPAQTGAQIATAGAAAADATGACGRCHGTEERGPASKLVPVLHGQTREFLIAALEQYTSGQRPSGIMQPIAAELGAEGVGKVAAYYAGLSRPDTPVASPAIVEPGRVLAQEGDRAARLPACDGCHGASALPIYPRLAGQNAPYMRARLRLWKQRLAADTVTAALMAPIALALSDEQIDDVSNYYASLRPEAVRP